MRVSDVTRRSRPFPGKKKNITLRFLNEATSARGALSGAHAVPRLFRAPSPTLRTRTTRSNDPRPDLLAPHLPGDPSRSIRRNFPRLGGERVFPCRSPSPPSRPRPPRARPYPGPPRAHAATVRPRSAPGRARYAPRHPEHSHPPPPRSERAPRTGWGARVRPKGQFITWRLRGFWRPTTRPAPASRWPSSSRSRARRGVGVITPAPPIRDVAPKSTRRQLTGSLPRSHPPRVTLGSLARINARRC